MTRLRLYLGLSDHERRELDQRRRTRNCFLALAVLIVISGFIAAN